MLPMFGGAEKYARATRTRERVSRIERAALRRRRSAASPLAPAERGEKRVAHLARAIARDELAAIDLAHVEDVRYARPLGVDLGDVDRERELVHRLGERKEETGPIFREHLDDRVLRRATIVDRHLGGHVRRRPFAPA